MKIYHLHKGVMSMGKLKSHPVSQKHKDKKVQLQHDLAMKSKPVKVVTKKENKIDNDVSIQFVKKQDNDISFEIDGDGYIFIDLDKTNTKGLKLVFTRKEGSETSRYGKKRTVSLQFENLPAPNGRLFPGKFVTRQKY